jgi:DNA polymerase-3 subunit delta
MSSGSGGDHEHLPVRLLWGDDPFLLREAALAALGNLEHPAEADAQAWQGGELQDLATPSLFGEPRGLLVTCLRAPSKEVLGELATYLAAPDPAAALVITCEVGERAAKAPAALTKLIEPFGEVRKVAVDRKGLEAWLLDRAKASQIDLAGPAARALVDTLGEDPGQLAAALDQLADAFPGQSITKEQVAKQFRGIGEQKVWDLCDRAFSKDLPGAIRSLRSLEEGRDEPLMLLGGIAGRLRDLIKVREQPDGLSPRDLAAAAGLRFDWQARRYRDQVRNFSMPELLRLHARITETDRALKSGSTGDVVMPALIAEIATRG